MDTAPRLARHFPFVQSICCSGSTWLQQDAFGLTPQMRPGDAILISLPPLATWS
jgi:hypothetical protein